MSSSLITRRGFLSAIVAGAALAATTSPAFALVEDVYLTRVKKVISLVDELYAMATFTPTPWIVRVRYRPNFHVPKTEYLAKFEEILVLLCEVEVPKKGTQEYKKASQEVHDLFSNKIDSDKYRDIPPTLTPATFGVAVVFDLISIHLIKIDPRFLPSFDAFADKYQHVILNT